MWLNTGMYMIKAVHGASASNIISDTVTIEYGGGEAPTSPSPEPTDDPLAGIDAAITGGTITSISPGSDPSIIIIINAVDDGMLTLTIPRDILESKVDGQDGDDVPFNVLVDNNEIDAVETAGATSRTLEIEFAAGSEVIEVLGSWIIPEFGVVAIAVLAVAIVSIMVVSARSKIGIVPRF